MLCVLSDTSSGSPFGVFWEVFGPMGATMDSGLNFRAISATKYYSFGTFLSISYDYLSCCESIFQEYYQFKFMMTFLVVNGSKKVSLGRPNMFKTM